jgi:hypothetical protein
MKTSEVIDRQTELFGQEIVVDGFLVAPRKTIWYLAPDSAQVKELRSSIAIGGSTDAISPQELVDAYRENRRQWLDLCVQLRSTPDSSSHMLKSMKLLPNEEWHFTDQYRHYTYATLTGRLEPANDPDFSVMLIGLSQAVLYYGDETVYLKMGGVSFADISFKNEHERYQIDDLQDRQHLPFGEIVGIEGLLLSARGQPEDLKIVSEKQFHQNRNARPQGILVEREFSERLWRRHLLPIEVGGPVAIAHSGYIVGTLNPSGNEGRAIIQDIKELAYEFAHRVVHWLPE